MTSADRRRPCILQVGPSPPTDGGIATYVEGMLESPLGEHYDLPLFDVRVPESCQRHRLLRVGLAVRFLWGFRQRLRRTAADAVHLHTSGHLGFWEKSLMARTAVRAGRPYILHLHGGDFDRFVTALSGWQRRQARRVFAAAGGVIVLSESWKSLFEDWVVPDRLHVVPNAIVMPRTPPRVARHQGPVRILFVGMISPRKGLDELVLAVSRLVAEGVRNFHIDLVGGEEVFGEAIRYRKLFRQQGIGDWVTFHGLKLAGERDVFYERADIHVLPSRSESFGIANLEAMAHGLPVVSTRTGAIPEYLTDGEQGLLFEPGDAAGLTRSLRRLIEDPALRARLGAAARQRAQRYDWQVLWTDLDRVYRCALSTRDARRR